MAKVTTDHQEIQRWVEARGGCGAHVKRTGGKNDVGVLRVDFPGYSGEETLECIDWDTWFAKFDEQELAFIYQDRTRQGRPSRFNKLVRRESVNARQAPARRQKGSEESAPQDALDLLASQHRRLEELALALTQESPKGGDFRRKFLEAADLLALHSVIEEQIFYPAVRKKDTERLVRQSLEDHVEVKRVLSALLDARPGDEDLGPELEELVGLTEEHILDEEHDLFPKVRRLLSPDALAELGEQMRQLASELQEEGEPRRHVGEGAEPPAHT